ncbi:hypothetical protein [Spirosoma pomorum]
MLVSNHGCDTYEFWSLSAGCQVDVHYVIPTSGPGRRSGEPRDALLLPKIPAPAARS